MKPQTKKIWLTVLFTILTFLVISFVVVPTLLLSYMISVILITLTILAGILFVVFNVNKSLGWGFIIGGIASIGTVVMCFYIIQDFFKDLLNFL